jgi:hypothetical protein
MWLNTMKDVMSLKQLMILSVTCSRLFSTILKGKGKIDEHLKVWPSMNCTLIMNKCSSFVLEVEKLV